MEGRPLQEGEACGRSSLTWLQLGGPCFLGPCPCCLWWLFRVCLVTLYLHQKCSRDCATSPWPAHLPPHSIPTVSTCLWSQNRPRYWWIYACGCARHLAKAWHPSYACSSKDSWSQWPHWTPYTNIEVDNAGSELQMMQAHNVNLYTLSHDSLFIACLLFVDDMLFVKDLSN